MDLNHLIHRHQVSLMRADEAACGEARHAHRRLASAYAGQISEFRAELGANGLMVPSA